MSDKINLGVEVHYFENGEVTENIPFRNFKNILLISGGTCGERFVLLSYVLNQFHLVFPNFGVLLIQLGSSEDNYLFQLDKVYKYGDSELIVPYFAGGKYNGVNREHFTR